MVADSKDQIVMLVTALVVFIKIWGSNIKTFADPKIRKFNITILTVNISI